MTRSLMHTPMALTAALLTGCPDQSVTAVNAPPEVTITSHADGDVLLQGETVSFTGIASDPDHPAEGSAVLVTGVVVTAITGSGFYAQDPAEADFAGCYVYTDDPPTVSLGDVVNLAGEYMEYYGLCEVAYADVEVTDSTAVPAPVTVSACDVSTSGSDGERYEAMLVRVENVTVTSSNPDDTSDYGAMEVDGCLRVDDQIFEDLPTVDDTGWSYRDMHQTYSFIQGPLHYGYSNYKLEPRDEDDLELGG